MTLQRNQPGVAAITGSASGLGRALALHLAERGWTLELSDVNGELLEESASLCRAHGATVSTAVVDTAKAEDVQQWCDVIYQRHATCDLLVNNAGVAAVGLVGQMSLELWDWVIDINLKGPLHGCHYFVPRMRKQERGHVVNVASIAAFASAPNMGAYNTTKSAVVSLSETLKGELEGTPIGVTVACPSFFNTAIGDNTRGASAKERALLDKVVNQSKISADEIAEQILEAAELDKLYVMPQPDAKAMWALRRVLPAQFHRLSTAAIRFMERRAKG